MAKKRKNLLLEKRKLERELVSLRERIAVADDLIEQHGEELAYWHSLRDPAVMEADTGRSVIDQAICAYFTREIGERMDAVVRSLPHREQMRLMGKIQDGNRRARGHAG